MIEKVAPDSEFESLLSYVQESRGLDFRGYKRSTLRRRISLRMEALGAEDFASYRACLEAQPGEFEDLLNTVLINVTSFFRDPEAWEVLKTRVIPALAGDDRPIRVWSVGCATGQEPYSLAMLLAEQLGTLDFGRRVKIYATDLDEEALKVARLASYSPREVEGVPPDLLEKYFQRTNNHYLFEREVRKCVIFGRHNVVHDAPISRVDLLVCRNLLIYLEGETQAVVLPRLHYALARDGYLFLGKAETQLARSALFRPVEMKHRIFSKVALEWRRPLGTLASLGNGRAEAPKADLDLPEAVLNEAGTAMLVVDDLGAVVLANQPARQMFGVTEADLGRPFQDLPISYRPMELRGPIDEVFRQRLGARLEEQEYRLNQNEVMRLTIDLRPVVRADGRVHAVLLIFTDDTRLHTLKRELEAAQENLENSIEELQSANEELETTNEELQSTNEELETTNEELQSTNEELETLNEEARSTNDEMEAVNEELRLHASQAKNYRHYLESVLRAMNGGIIVVDHKHVIQSWNRWCENSWGFRAEEVIGTSLAALDISFPLHLLRQEMAEVHAGGRERTEHILEGIDRRGRRLICRVTVCGLLDEAAEIQGLVLLFQDITEERRDEEHSHYLGRVMHRTLDAIYFLDPESLRFVLTNESGRKRLGYGVSQLAQMSFGDVLPAMRSADLRALLTPLLAGTEEQIAFETIVRGPDDQEASAEISIQYLADELPPVLAAIVRESGGGHGLAPPSPPQNEPAVNPVPGPATR